MKKDVMYEPCEINCFFSALARIMQDDEKWSALSTQEKSEISGEAVMRFVTNYYEGINGFQSGADVIFFLLKSMGYKEDIEARWNELLSEPPIENVIKELPNPLTKSIAQFNM